MNFPNTATTKAFQVGDGMYAIYTSGNPSEDLIWTPDAFYELISISYKAIINASKRAYYNIYYANEASDPIAPIWQFDQYNLAASGYAYSGYSKPKFAFLKPSDKIRFLLASDGSMEVGVLVKQVADSSPVKGCGIIEWFQGECVHGNYR